MVLHSGSHTCKLYLCVTEPRRPTQVKCAKMNDTNHVQSNIEDGFRISSHDIWRQDRHQISGSVSILMWKSVMRGPRVFY